MGVSDVAFAARVCRYTGSQFKLSLWVECVCGDAACGHHHAWHYGADGV